MGTPSEKDMQVREIKEGYKFADKLFAKYPLLGNAILKESTQDKINEQAKKHWIYSLKILLMFRVCQ